MDLGLKDKVAIVTGGGSNIGKAISLAFGAEGSKVVIADIDEVQAQKVVAQIKSSGGHALAIKTDVTKPDSVADMVKGATDNFGAVDILINNVGWTQHQVFIQKPRAEWEKEVNLNLWGVINCSRAVLDTMVAKKAGKIVSISSDSGRMGEYMEAVYAACKAGVIGLSKALARELGRYNINVNVICPGATPPKSQEDVSKDSMWQEGLKFFGPEQQQKAAMLYPLRRLGKPEEIAYATLFLSSKCADYITGQTLSVSGGYTMM